MTHSVAKSPVRSVGSGLRYLSRSSVVAKLSDGIAMTFSIETGYVIGPDGYWKSKFY